MRTPLEILAAVVALGLLMVIIPYWLSTWSELRRGRTVRCPRTGSYVHVSVDALRAALKAPLHDSPPMHVTACALWPRPDCDQSCVRAAGR